MHPAVIIGTVGSLWTWLWGRYHVPQFLVLINVTWKVEKFRRIARLKRSIDEWREAKHFTYWTWYWLRRIEIYKTVNTRLSLSLWMNFADCCMNELEFRICTNCKKIQYKIYKLFEKCQRLLSTFVNVCYIFTINAFINVYYYFLDV